MDLCFDFPLILISTYACGAWQNVISLTITQMKTALRFDSANFFDFIKIHVQSRPIPIPAQKRSRLCNGPGSTSIVNRH